MNKSIITALLFACFILGTLAADLFADDVYRKNREANRLFEQQKYEEALRLYEDALLLDPSEAKLRMNKGSALYKLQDYDAALEAYSGALSQEDKDALADAHYNLGNIFFRNGQKLQSAGDPAAREKYQQALENYIQSLELRPDDHDSKWNLQLAHQMIEEVEMQQDKQQSDDSSESDDDQEGEQQAANQPEEKDGEDDQQQSGDDESSPEEQESDTAAQEEDNEQDLQEQEAARLIEMYADDADELHKPQQQKQSGARKPEKDW